MWDMVNVRLWSTLSWTILSCEVSGPLILRSICCTYIYRIRINYFFKFRLRSLVHDSNFILFTRYLYLYFSQIKWQKNRIIRDIKLLGDMIFSVYKKTTCRRKKKSMKYSKLYYNVLFHDRTIVKSYLRESSWNEMYKILLTGIESTIPCLFFDKYIILSYLCSFQYKFIHLVSLHDFPWNISLWNYLYH